MEVAIEPLTARLNAQTGKMIINPTDKNQIFRDLDMQGAKTGVSALPNMHLKVAIPIPADPIVVIQQRLY